MSVNALLYWTIQHRRHGWQQFRFSLRCWRLRREIERLSWRLRLKAILAVWASPHRHSWSIGQEAVCRVATARRPSPFFQRF
ncbi:MAG TPA: hypothetical protein VJL88_02125 [Nitrospira sp.]|nr:hypothetical protein [Nitrospira sp.]